MSLNLPRGPNIFPKHVYFINHPPFCIYEHVVFKKKMNEQKKIVERDHLPHADQHRSYGFYPS